MPTARQIEAARALRDAKIEAVEADYSAGLNELIEARRRYDEALESRNRELSEIHGVQAPSTATTTTVPTEGKADKKAKSGNIAVRAGRSVKNFFTKED